MSLPLRSPLHLHLIAPFLGQRSVWAAIARQGGLQAWQQQGAACGEAQGPAEDWALWQWLASSAPCSPGHAPTGVQLNLAWARQDRFARSHRLLAEILPDRQVVVQDGQHDWPAWCSLTRALLRQVGP